MIPNPFERRRAERFALLLDEAQGTRRRHSHRAEAEGLSEFVSGAHSAAEQLSTVADQVTVDAAYRRRLRQRLLAVGHAQGIGAAADQPLDGEPAHHELRTGRGAKIAVAAGAAAGVLALSGVSSASSDALPGEALYGVKRQTERAQLALAGSEVNRGQLHLGFAGTRLTEAAALAEDPDGLDAALDDMDRDVRTGVRLLTTAAAQRQDPELLNSVRSFAEKQKPTLLDLIDGLRGAPRERAASSLKLLTKADTRAESLGRDLRCAGDSPVDSLGPIPSGCSTLGAPDRPSASGSAEDTTSSRAPHTSGSPQRDKADAAREPSPTGLLPTGGGGTPPSESPRSSPSGNIIDELGRILGNLLR